MSDNQHALSNDINYNKPVTLAGLTEKSLAAYQHNQVGNTCTLHSISAAIQLLSGRVIDPAELADELDAMNFFQRLPYRFGKNGPVSPLQQVSLLRRLIKDMGLSLQVVYPIPTLPGLIDLIHQPDTVVMVTIGWAKHAAPAITLGTGTSSYANNIVSPGIPSSVLPTIHYILIMVGYKNPGVSLIPGLMVVITSSGWRMAIFGKPGLSIRLLAVFDRQWLFPINYSHSILIQNNDAPAKPFSNCHRFSEER